MQKHQQTHRPPSFFLEQWLLQQSSSSPASPPPQPPPSAARAILQSWADLRQNPTSDQLLSSLHTLLSNSPASLHVADPHAGLLLSLLSSAPSPSLPLILRLLYIWTRKSSRPSLPLLESAVQNLSSTPISAPPPLLILLLGALSAFPTLPSASRSTCSGAIERLLAAVGKGGKIAPELLAGIGYSLIRCGSVEFLRKLVSWVLGFWVSSGASDGSVREGLMVMALVEWVVGEWIKLRSLQEIQVLCEVISEVGSDPFLASRFAVVASAAGVLRAFWMGGAASGLGLTGGLRQMVEGALSGVANFVVSRVGNGYGLGEEAEMHLIACCIALGLARCGPVEFNNDLMLCVCFGLLNEILPLRLFDVDVVAKSDGMLKVGEHLDSVLFKEAGAVSGVLCNQYALANEESRSIVEDYIWRYCLDFYSKFHIVLLSLKQKNEEFIQELEKMAESVFLMVVVFASQLSKQKLYAPSSISIHSDLAVRILIAFSCVEYLRRVRWPEYSDIVRRAVLILQEDCRACALFLGSMPSYSELTNISGGSSLEGMKYSWLEDEVQTARVLFYLRVIPTCISNFAAPFFSEKVVPTMFLYMSHPNEKVARASHALFVAFISSSAKESNSDDQTDLKEKLVFYYMEKSLEGFPGVTPFEGLTSGVIALIRHLPSGSAAIFYCTSCLVDKAVKMFELANRQDPDLWKNWEHDSDPCKKILELLLRLVSLVDIQVFPHLLKLLAQFVVNLPKEGQRNVLNEMHAVVAESDDVIRKPTLVSWLQSLSYLSTHTYSRSKSLRDSSKTQFIGENKQDGNNLNLNGSQSRL